MLRGAFAAALTPLRAGGAELDEEAIEAYVEFLAGGGLDGLLALGTTGEGILLAEDERRRAAERFVEAAGDSLAVVVHCGAQTTAETVALARHAAEIGAGGVAVIGPPYFAFDEEALRAHFVAAGRACAPLPFYLYEFRSRAGYALPPPLVGTATGACGAAGCCAAESEVITCAGAGEFGQRPQNDSARWLTSSTSSPVMTQDRVIGSFRNSILLRKTLL